MHTHSNASLKLYCTSTESFKSCLNLQNFSSFSLQSADTVHMYVHKKLYCFLIGWESNVWQNKTLFCNTDLLDMNHLQWNSFESFRKACKCENQGNGRVSQTCICVVETQFIAIFLFQLKMKQKDYRNHARLALHGVNLIFSSQHVHWTAPNVSPSVTSVCQSVNILWSIDHHQYFRFQGNW